MKQCGCRECSVTSTKLALGGGSQGAPVYTKRMMMSRGAENIMSTHAYIKTKLKNILKTREIHVLSATPMLAEAPCVAAPIARVPSSVYL